MKLARHRHLEVETEGLGRGCGLAGGGVGRLALSAGDVGPVHEDQAGALAVEGLRQIAGRLGSIDKEEDGRVGRVVEALADAYAKDGWVAAEESGGIALLGGEGQCEGSCAGQGGAFRGWDLGWDAADCGGEIGGVEGEGESGEARVVAAGCDGDALGAELNVGTELELGER